MGTTGPEYNAISPIKTTPSKSNSPQKPKPYQRSDE